MIAIIKREISNFFASPIGYLVIGIFLVINGLFLWIFSGNYNILDAGFADVSAFFELAPWVLMFLIPAVTMRSFSDERKMGTLELLLTKPVSLRNIILGKYIGVVILILFALVPTLLYVVTISKLGNPPGTWDVGSTIGSYYGLIFLVLAYNAIGLFSSTLSSNQVVAFIIAVFLSFAMYYGFEGLRGASSGWDIAKLGMKAHFDSVSRGVIDTRDLSYFIGVSIVFLMATKFSLDRKSPLRKSAPGRAFYMLIVLVALVYFGSTGKRYDFTSDKRYTLSNAAKATIATVDSPVVIDVFLKGNFPPEFRRLQAEAKQMLEEFSAFNSNINYEFVNPLDDDDPQAAQQLLSQYGLTPAQVDVRESGKVSTELVYPWALAYYRGKTVKIPLLKNQLGTTTEERVNSSVRNLEYTFADGFNKLVQPKRRKVAVLKGNGELEDRHIVDFFRTLRENYFIAPFTLDSAAIAPQRTLEQLTDFDLIVAAQPTEAFSDTEKYILDQYTMNGGASLWLMDATTLRNDSISGNTFAFGQDVGLTDFFFKYGIRINPNLVKDVYAAPIVLASGEQQESQYNQYPWFYSPLSSSSNNHPIVTNIEAVKFDYASAIDTLPNSVEKTVLLSSSPLTKIVGVPSEIDITKEINNNLKVVNEGPAPGEFAAGETPLAVLLEGQFPSVYTNRVKPFRIPNDKTESVNTRMVVISDGDVIRNQFQGNRPLELGFDKWTNSFYGNKEFLLNTVNYLLDDSGLINIRTKEIVVPFLDAQKAVNERTKWQMINLLLPLALLGLFGLVFSFLRKRKYAR